LISSSKSRSTSFIVPSLGFDSICMLWHIVRLVGYSTWCVGHYWGTSITITKRVKLIWLVIIHRSSSLMKISLQGSLPGWVFNAIDSASMCSFSHQGFSYTCYAIKTIKFTSMPSTSKYW
jgi:hypothetical protein